MSKEKLFLAFDTSNYTTSCGLCNEAGDVVLNLKLPLPVKDGERGLRQSDALFHHTNRLPTLIRDLKFDGEIVAVGYSARPRDVEGSYMPCFLAGRSIAEGIGAAMQKPVYSFSHQNGHIMAALYSCNRTDLVSEDFYAFHVSGGTTEVLSVSHSDEYVFSVNKIGGTLDLNAGQVIDRIGVLMGLSFPCGKELEKLALSYECKIDKYKVSVKDIECNLSGLESKAAALFKETGDKCRVAAFVIKGVADTLKSITENLLINYGEKPIVYAGGVMSCSVIRDMLSCYGSFASPDFSCDNAAGTSLLTRYSYYKNKEL